LSNLIPFAVVAKKLPLTSKLAFLPNKIPLGLIINKFAEVKIGLNPQNLIEFKYYNPSDDIVIYSSKQLTISLKNRLVLIGRDANATLVLDAPTVLWRHATINTNAKGRYILQDYTYVKPIYYS
jgi:hypothetical protein